MRSAIKPLPLSCRMSDGDYPGVLRCFGGAWRLVVSLDGRRYRLQPLVGDGGAWASPSSLVASSLSALCAKGAGLVDGLAVACEGLPDDPALALPDLVAARAVQLVLVAGGVASNTAKVRAARAAFFSAAAAKRAAVGPAPCRRGPVRPKAL